MTSFLEKQPKRLTRSEELKFSSWPTLLENLKTSVFNLFDHIGPTTPSELLCSISNIIGLRVQRRTCLVLRAWKCDLNRLNAEVEKSLGKSCELSSRSAVPHYREQEMEVWGEGVKPIEWSQDAQE